MRWRCEPCSSRWMRLRRSRARRPSSGKRRAAAGAGAAVRAAGPPARPWTPTLQPGSNPAPPRLHPGVAAGGAAFRGHRQLLVVGPGPPGYGAGVPLRPHAAGGGARQRRDQAQRHRQAPACRVRTLRGTLLRVLGGAPCFPAAGWGLARCSHSPKNPGGGFVRRFKHIRLVPFYDLTVPMHGLHENAWRAQPRRRFLSHATRGGPTAPERPAIRRCAFEQAKSSPTPITQFCCDCTHICYTPQARRTGLWPRSHTLRPLSCALLRAAAPPAMRELPAWRLCGKDLICGVAYAQMWKVFFDSLYRVIASAPGFAHHHGG